MTNGGKVEVGNFGTFVTTGTSISGGGLFAGYSGGSTGTITVDNGGTLISAGEAVIGRNGNGTLDIGSNGAVSLGIGGTILPFSLDVGEFGGSSGTVVVSGPGALLTGTGDFRIGDGGFGLLDVNNGGSVSVGGTLYVSPNFGGGTAVVDGGTVHVAGAVIGGSSSGVLVVQNNGTFLDDSGLTIGNGSFQSGTVVVSGFAARLVANGAGIAVGYSNSGLLLVENQGSVSTSSLALGGSATAPVSGDGTVGVISSSDVSVSGNAAVWAGSTLYVNSNSAIDIGGSSFTPGNISIEGGHTLTGSGLVASPVINNGTILAVSNTGTNIFPQGTLELTGTVAGAGVIDIGSNAILRLDAAPGGSQSINFSSGGAELILETPNGALTNFVGGLAIGDKIEFNFGVGVNITSAAVSGGTIALGLSNGSTYDLTNVSFAAGAPQTFLWGTNSSSGTQLELDPGRIEQL